jgi:beta-phosphoglucomutase-like phosphatase (HAD superfamily)
MSLLSRPSRRSRVHAGAGGRRRVVSRKPAPRISAAPGPATQPPRRPELDSIAAQWQRSLDAGERALGAAAGTLPASYLRQRRLELGRERQQTAELLAGLAKVRGLHPLPWLSPVRVNARMLGLPETVGACLFDLDGVLSDSVLLHARAWGEVFDAFLLQMTEDSGLHFPPFDRGADYRAYIDGHTRIEGIHAFLDSRGIRLPEGKPDDPPQARSAWGLANRKGDAIERGLQQRGVTALPGVRRYLEAAGHAGLKRAAVSASASTLPMLERAALATLVEAHVDADVIRSEDIRTPPAPDLLLAACRRLDVPPERAVTFTHSPAGVAAGQTAGLTVIGVGEGRDEELLCGFGAPRVVPGLRALLDPRLLDANSGDAHR